MKNKNHYFRIAGIIIFILEVLATPWGRLVEFGLVNPTAAFFALCEIVLLGWYYGLANYAGAAHEVAAIHAQQRNQIADMAMGLLIILLWIFISTLKITISFSSSIWVDAFFVLWWVATICFFQLIQRKV